MIVRLRVLGSTMLLLCALALPAAAHPLGNFTINHLTKLKFDGTRASVHYVLDMAEIPTYQAMRDVTPDGKMDAAQIASWAQTEAATIVPQLKLAAGGTAVPLALDRASAHTRPGAGGLPTMYLTVDAHGTLPSGARALTYADETFPGRLGWHDVVVLPATEPTSELQLYPSALIGSPRATTNVNIALAADGHAVAQAVSTDDAAAGSGAPPVSAARSNQLSDMLARGTSDWGFVLLTFAVAIALGALHALEPGHGKTLLAISLVGARATVKQAGILAASLTVAHTIGVLALGVAINLFKGYFVPESIYPWITLGSGLVIAVIGARAVQRQIQQRQPLAHAHAHAHDHVHPHEHDHVHDPLAHDAHAHASHAHGSHSHEPHSHAPHAHHDHDDLEHARAHAIPGNAPLTFGGTVWAAMSGGVAPCPAALVVLLAAVALNQVTYGIFVIVAFSFGLAITLTGLGIAVVRGAGWLQGRPQFERFVKYGPLASAIVIATIGAVMVGQGFGQQGVSMSPLVVTGITALAIIGYAFSHPFAHRRVEVA
jgi:ABC-type nickel/cobalt efflux system permease component RcnA